jgi:hypothetical protein
MTVEHEIIETKIRRTSEVGENWVEIKLPLVTVSEANGGAKKRVKRVKNKVTTKVTKSEHWTDKHARHKRQKGAVALLLKPLRSHLKLPCHITLTRYAPSKLDRFDNLPMSMKWILDACCEIITGDYRPGRADDTEEIDVKYKQVESIEYGVKIRIDMKDID